MVVNVKRHYTVFTMLENIVAGEVQHLLQLLFQELVENKTE